MKKRSISLLLALVMCVTLCLPAFAANAGIRPDPIQQLVDEKMEIIRPQLSDQNALFLEDEYEAILYEMFSSEFNEQNSVLREDGSVNNVYAPRGGSVAYQLPREWGTALQNYIAVGCTAAQGEEWINTVTSQRTVANAIDKVLGYMGWIPSYITTGASLLLQTTVAINTAILNDIDSCNGRVLVINTISYIDNAAHPAVCGWPTTSIPVPYNATSITSYVN